MNKISQAQWNLVATGGFMVINIVALYLLSTDLDIPVLLSKLSALTFLIFALGVYRLTDIIVYEQVTQPVRDWFKSEPDQNGFKGFMSILLSCNACTGVWVAMFSFYLFLLFPTLLLIFMTIMALTGAERFLSKFYNLLEKK